MLSNKCIDKQYPKISENSNNYSL